MKRIKYVVLMVLSVCLFFAFINCKNETTIEPRVRIFVNGRDMNDAEIRVFVESETGMSISGAFVYIKDSVNEITVLEYDTTKNQYYGNFSISKNDLIIVYVDSILFSEPKQYTIKTACLTERPVVTSFTDENGSSVLLGESLNHSFPFRLSWNNVCDDSIYRIS